MYMQVLEKYMNNVFYLSGVLLFSFLDLQKSKSCCHWSGNPASNLPIDLFHAFTFILFWPFKIDGWHFHFGSQETQETIGTKLPRHVCCLTSRIDYHYGESNVSVSGFLCVCGARVKFVWFLWNTRKHCTAQRIGKFKIRSCLTQVQDLSIFFLN